MFLFKLKLQPDVAVSDILMMLVRGKLEMSQMVKL